MRCPFCRAQKGRVLDSRTMNDGNAIRRRRVCSSCERRFTTYERPEVAPRMVIKKDGTRAVFSRDKVLRGMVTACEKRHISMADLNEIVDRVELELFDGNLGGHVEEVATSAIGEKVSLSLKSLDQVAYVRFTSVYREFRDVHEFLAALEPLLREPRGRTGDGDAGSRGGDTVPSPPGDGAKGNGASNGTSNGTSNNGHGGAGAPPLGSNGNGIRAARGPEAPEERPRDGILRDGRSRPIG